MPHAFLDNTLFILNSKRMRTIVLTKDYTKVWKGFKAADVFVDNGGKEASS